MTEENPGKYQNWDEEELEGEMGGLREKEPSPERDDTLNEKSDQLKEITRQIKETGQVMEDYGVERKNKA